MRVFLSFVSQDADVARQIRKQLIAAGHDIFEVETSTQDSWEENLGNSQAFIPILSSSYEKSSLAKSQLVLARASNVPILPILMQDVVKNPLAKLPRWLFLLLTIIAGLGGPKAIGEFLPLPPVLKIPWLLIGLGVTFVAKRNPALPKSFLDKLAHISVKNEDVVRATPTEEIAFTHYYPGLIKPKVEATLHMYIHLASLSEEIQRDFEYQKVAQELHLTLTQQANKPVTRGTTFTIVPRITGVKINPERADVTWIDDIEHVEFKLKLEDKVKENVGLAGKISIYAGAFVVATLPIISKAGKGASESAEFRSATGFAYKRIFVSYSSKDRQVVELIDDYYKRYGDIKTFIDFKFLRAGDNWQEEILRKIEEADALQLFWSENAAASEHVRAEWEYALKLPRPIIPIHVPPKTGIPAELNHIHFENVESFIKRI